MKIKTWEIAKLTNGLPIDYIEDLKHLFNENKQIEQVSPVHVTGLASKLAKEYTVKGTVTVDLKIQCSRCLTHYHHSIKNDFAEIFIQSSEELAVLGDNVTLLDSDQIDLSPVVEEAVILAIPLAPVCSSECKGLCYECGIDLNRHTCECEKNKINPKFADLAKLFDQTTKTE